MISKTVLSATLLATVSSAHAFVQILDLSSYNLILTPGLGFSIDVDNNANVATLDDQFEFGTIASLQYPTGSDLGITFDENEYIDFTATYAQLTTASDSGLVDRLGSGVTFSYIDGPNTGGNTVLEMTGDGAWNETSGIAYAGFSFNNNSDVYNAWAEMNYNDAENQLQIMRIGWQTTANTSITTPSAVPEPTSYTLLAMSFIAGLSFRRRA